MPKTSYRHLFWQIFKTAFVGGTGFRVPIPQYHLQQLSKIYQQWKTDKDNPEN